MFPTTCEVVTFPSQHMAKTVSELPRSQDRATPRVMRAYTTEVHVNVKRVKMMVGLSDENTR